MSKPEGRIKIMKGVPAKVDYHIHEKGHKLRNWWEEINDTVVSRTTIKSLWLRDIESELLDEFKINGV